MSGQLISTAADFPRVRVYRQDNRRGSVFRIAFKNKEHRSLGNQISWMGGAPLAMILYSGWVVQPVMELGYYDRQAVWGVGIVSAFALLFLMWRIGLWPTRSRCVIELDYGADRLRVLRNGYETVARQLSRYWNFTIEPHPMAQREAAEKRGVIGPFQKQHCLFGWFGAAGSEKVMLLARWEWPSQDSLFEVRQALLWAMAQPRAKDGAAQPEGQGAQPGIKPPLD